MASNQLKLNKGKTVYIIFGSKRNIKKLGDQSISVGGNNISSVPVVRNLRMDSTLNFHDHISFVCKNAMANICFISSLRNCLTEEATKTLVQSLVISRLDYCNFIYYGLPEGEIKRLQHIQNSAARLIKRKGKYCSISK